MRASSTRWPPRSYAFAPRASECRSCRRYAGNWRCRSPQEALPAVRCGPLWPSARPDTRPRCRRVARARAVARPPPWGGTRAALARRYWLRLRARVPTHADRARVRRRRWTPRAGTPHELSRMLGGQAGIDRGIDPDFLGRQQQRQHLGAVDGHDRHGVTTPHSHLGQHGRGPVHVGGKLGECPDERRVEGLGTRQQDTAGRSGDSSAARRTSSYVLVGSPRSLSGTRSTDARSSGPWKVGHSRSLSVVSAPMSPRPPFRGQVVQAPRPRCCKARRSRRSGRARRRPP